MSMHTDRRPLGLVWLVIAALGAPAWAQERGGAVPGEAKSGRTRALETGARVLQRAGPPARLDVHLVGFHPMKDDPLHQMEAHHYCEQVNEDFAQCVLFDGPGPTARMNGIEFIISEKLFAGLPAPERGYWHPHNGEILSGQLVAPGLPAAAEKAFMRQKMNSYGKTWHLWDTGAPGRAGTALPLGPAMLAWSFSREGEAMPALVERRDAALGIRTADKRRERADLEPLARPQSGVDDLRRAFPQARDIPGVVDVRRPGGSAASAAGSASVPVR